MNVISLFAGCGGLDLGFERAGFNVIWANECDSTIFETYRKNHPKTMLNTTDVHLLKEQVFPSCDGVIGGPQCQAWSEGGKQLGFEGPRDQLFLKYVRIVKVKKPKFFFIENVPGILEDKHKLSLTFIIESLQSIGYFISYKTLQKELAESITSRAVLVTMDFFKGKTITKDNGEKLLLCEEKAATIMEELISQGYVKKQKLTDKYFEDKKEGNIILDGLQEEQNAIIKELDKVFNPDILKPSNGRGKETAKFKVERFAKKEFQSLWKRINRKTYYEVNFETKRLIDNAVKELNDSLHVTEIHVAITSGVLSNINSKEELAEGRAMSVNSAQKVTLQETVARGVRYDLVGELVQRTGLKRSTIVAILIGIKPETFGLYRKKPEEFIIRVGNIINEQKAIAVIEHITYHKMEQQYDANIFSEQELRGRIGLDALPSEKSLYDLVVVDSQGTEKHFAEQLEQQDAVEVYTKLPRGFYINTPVGKYNPDWAIVFREGAVKHIYFVAETKGSEEITQLRAVERAKIECASRHFASISDNQITFDVVKDYATLYNKVMQE